MSKIEYISAEEAAKKWGISDRSVRNYCAQGSILEGKTWKIPSVAEKRVIFLQWKLSYHFLGTKKKVL